jgi:hypothetical protein
MRNANRILIGKLKGTDHLGNVGVYGRIILKWMLRKQGMMV